MKNPQEMLAGEGGVRNLYLITLPLLCLSKIYYRVDQFSIHKYVDSQMMGKMHWRVVFKVTRQRELLKAVCWEGVKKGKLHGHSSAASQPLQRLIFCPGKEVKNVFKEK